MQPQQGALDLQPDVPFTRNHASYLSALKLATKPERRLWRTRAYLGALLTTAEGMTDREAYDALRASGCVLAGVSSVCSIRAAAMACGLVERGALVAGKFGTPNYRWQLTESGRGVINVEV